MVCSISVTSFWRNTTSRSCCKVRIYNSYGIYILFISRHLKWFASSVVDHSGSAPSASTFSHWSKNCLWHHCFYPISIIHIITWCNEMWLERFKSPMNLVQLIVVGATGPGLCIMNVVVEWQLLTPLVRLRQACCHPQVVRGRYLPLQKRYLYLSFSLSAQIQLFWLDCTW